MKRNILTLLFTSIISFSYPVTLKSQVPKKQTPAKIEVNDYLGLLVQEINLENNLITIHMFNISETDIKASFSSTYFEGRIIIKSAKKVRVFVSKQYNHLRLSASYYLHEPKELKVDEIISYKAKLEDYVDLHEKTNLRKFLTTDTEGEIYVKVIGKRFMVFPEIAAKTMAPIKSLNGSWQKFILKPKSPPAK